MALVLALLPDPIAHARAARAAESLGGNRGVNRVCRVGSWDEAHALTLRSATRAVIFDPFAAGALDAESCARFRAAFSSVVLFAYGTFGVADEVMRLAQVGVHGVAVRDLDDDPTILPGLLKRAFEHGFTDRVLATLEDGVAADLIPLFRYLLEHTAELVTPEQAARVACCHPKTLRERLRRAGLPSTAHLIVWTRLFRAAHLLEDVARTIENVAGQMEFPSAAALGNQLKRYACVSPAALRRSGGGLRLVLERFLSLYFDIREIPSPEQVAVALPPQPQVVHGSGESFISMSEER